METSNKVSEAVKALVVFDSTTWDALFKKIKEYVQANISNVDSVFEIDADGNITPKEAK